MKRNGVREAPIIDSVVRVGPKAQRFWGVRERGGAYLLRVWYDVIRAFMGIQAIMWIMVGIEVTIINIFLLYNHMYHQKHNQ